jgi:hypothetical protein
VPFRKPLPHKGTIGEPNGTIDANNGTVDGYMGTLGGGLVSAAQCERLPGLDI